MTKNNDNEIKNIATSIYNCLGKQIDREIILSNICNNLEELSIIKMNEIMKLYKKFDLLCGNKIIVMPKGRENSERIEAIAIEFNNEGNLIVQFNNRKKTIFII